MRWRSTTYDECIPESPEESITRDASRTTRAIYVPWNERFTAVRDFIGWPELRTAAAGNYISRVTPHRHPEAPYMVCVGSSRMQGIAPRGVNRYGEDAVARYEVAKVYLTYEATMYNIVEDADSIGSNGLPDDIAGVGRYIIPLFGPGGKFMNVPRGHLTWAEGVLGGRHFTAEAPRFIPEGEFTLNWIDTPALPIQAILNCAGKVNDALFFGFPAQTLLFIPPRHRPTTSPAPTPTGGVRTYDVPYLFRWLPNMDRSVPPVARGHNYLLQNEGATLEYRLATSDGTAGGDRLFRAADFRTLFRPDQ